MTAPKPHILPEARGLSRPQAAHYVGVSVCMFDAMVSDGRMPKPKEINSRIVWDRYALDVAFDALPDRGGAVNSWDAINENSTPGRNGMV